MADSSSKISYIAYDEAYEEGFEDMQRRVPDISRVHNLIGFKPSKSLDEIVSLVLKEQRS